MPGCRNSQRGWALPLVLMVIMVGSLLGAAIYQYSMSQSLSVLQENRSTQARYLARAAAEAAVRNWTQLTQKPTGTNMLERVWLVEDASGNRSYVLNSQLAGQKTIGYVDTKVERCRDTSGARAYYWVITSTARVGSTTQTVTATSVRVQTPTVSSGQAWYESSGYITRGVNSTTVTYNNETMTFTYQNEIPGAVNIECANAIQFNPSNPDAWRVIWPAYAIVFDNAVTAKMPEGKGPGVLVLAAERIVFNKELRIRLGVSYRFSRRTYEGGIVALAVPQGLGIKGNDVHAATGYANKVDRNARYGLVRFSKVLGTNYFTGYDERINSLCNKTFYFKQKDDGRSAIPIVVPDEFGTFFGVEIPESYDDQVQDLIAQGDLIPADPAVLVTSDPYKNVVWFWN